MDNRIGDAGAYGLGQGLRVNSSLHELNLVREISVWSRLLLLALFLCRKLVVLGGIMCLR